jgi:hypothetical protein
VAADLRLVAHAAERHADELAAGRAGDRLADRGLAGSRRADERQDRARAAVVGHAALRPELPHREVLDDALLHVVEAGVVGVQDRARARRVEALLRALAPGNREQPVEVGADHRAFGALLAHALEPADLALGLRAHRLRHAGVGDLGAVLVRDRAAVVAELLLDRVELAAEEVLALLLLRARFDVLADPLTDLHLGQALALETQGKRQSLDDVQRLEQLDFLLVGQIGRVARRVGERTRVSERA